MCTDIWQEPAALLISLPWRKKQHIPLKHQYTHDRLHKVTHEKPVIFTGITVGTSNFECLLLLTTTVSFKAHVLWYMQQTEISLPINIFKVHETSRIRYVSIKLWNIFFWYVIWRLSNDHGSSIYSGMRGLTGKTECCCLVFSFLELLNVT